MSKAMHSLFVALTVCFALAAGAQNTVQMGKDGKVKLQSGSSKIEVNKDGKKTTIESSDSTGVEVETDDDDEGTRTRTSTSSSSSSSSSSSMVELVGTARNQKVACSGNTEVVIKGASNNITITGDCKSVKVVGSANSVTLDTVAEIDVKGSANNVSWKKASGGAKQPKVDNAGVANNVFQEK
jgi:hypothetical protein